MTARCALWAPENFRESPSIRPRLFLPKLIFSGLLNRSILWMCVQNLKFLALHIPEIIGGTPKICAVPGYAHARFFPKFVMGFCWDEPCWMYLPNLKFVPLPVPEIIGCTENIWAVLRSRSLFSQICNGLLFGWTMWMYRPNLQSVTLAVPGIMAIAVLGWGCEPPILGKGRP